MNGLRPGSLGSALDRNSALAIVVALPGLALGFHLFTLWLPPILGYGASLALYWCVLAALILWRWHARPLTALLRPRRPGRGPLLVLVLVLGGLGTEAFGALSSQPPVAWLLICAVLAGVVNGTIEEFFWRGTLLVDDNAAWQTLACPIVLFVLWHVALVFANGVIVTGGAAGLLGGAAALGTLFMALRVASGSLGTAALAHIAVNVLAFSALVAANPL